MRGLEADPKFQNLLHWRRHQAPDLSREFGGEPEGRGAGADWPTGSFR
jgi:hypothetical protein